MSLVLDSNITALNVGYKMGSQLNFRSVNYPLNLFGPPRELKRNEASKTAPQRVYAKPAMIDIDANPPPRDEPFSYVDFSADAIKARVLTHPSIAKAIDEAKGKLHNGHDIAAEVESAFKLCAPNMSSWTQWFAASALGWVANKMASGGFKVDVESFARLEKHCKGNPTGRVFVFPHRSHGDSFVIYKIAKFLFKKWPAIVARANMRIAGLGWAESGVGCVFVPVRPPEPRPKPKAPDFEAPCEVWRAYVSELAGHHEEHHNLAVYRIHRAIYYRVFIELLAAGEDVTAFGEGTRSRKHRMTPPTSPGWLGELLAEAEKDSTFNPVIASIMINYGEYVKGAQYKERKPGQAPHQEGWRDALSGLWWSLWDNGNSAMVECCDFFDLQKLLPPRRPQERRAVSPPDAASALQEPRGRTPTRPVDHGGLGKRGFSPPGGANPRNPFDSATRAGIRRIMASMAKATAIHPINLIAYVLNQANAPTCRREVVAAAKGAFETQLQKYSDLRTADGLREDPASAIDKAIDGAIANQLLRMDGDNLAAEADVLRYYSGPVLDALHIRKVEAEIAAQSQA